jgi:cytochrome c oxidase subunit II
MHTILPILADSGTFWLPEAASTLAPEIDSLFYFVYWASLILFTGVVAAVIYFAVRYRRRAADERPDPIKENKMLEISWIVLPTILVLILFNWGFRTYVRISVPPPDSYEIRVLGAQFLWQFTYPNGTVTTNELVVPRDRPIRLVMSSQDVLHSFFVPAFRVKMDVLPNRYTSVWFQATRDGTYDIFCTEYCGTQHSGMLATVTVVGQDQFNEWLATSGIDEDMPLPELGAVLFRQQACHACHSIDGTRGVGPTMQGLYGTVRQFTDGTSAVADDNYLRESILQPNAKIVAGYAPIMPATYTNLSERELAGLIEYIKELQ